MSIEYARQNLRVRLVMSLRNIILELCSMLLSLFRTPSSIASRSTGALRTVGARVVRLHLCDGESCRRSPRIMQPYGVPYKQLRLLASQENLSTQENVNLIFLQFMIEENKSYQILFTESNNVVLCSQPNFLEFSNFLKIHTFTLRVQTYLNMAIFGLQCLKIHFFVL